ncbi:MAG: glycosyltransferase family 39 protein [Deferribacteres bacterium]|nr:glycosyltransferase family 39 protein [Deferribacteres bacterium]
MKTNGINGGIKKTDKRAASFFLRLGLLSEDDHPLLKRVVMAWFAFLLIMMAWGLRDVAVSWQKARGWEYLWIAESIVKGDCFCFADCKKGWRPREGCDKFRITAHEEPVYPYLTAAAFKALGSKYGGLLVMIFQVIALFFTSCIVYLLGRRVFNAPAGLLAGSVLPLLNRHLTATFVPSIFAGLMIAISAYLILLCIEKVSVRRGIILGLTLGFTALLYAPTLAFIPVAVFFLLVGKTPRRSIALKTAAVVIFTAAAVLSVWTIRNFMVFGQIIPVRTGFGINVHQSNPVLAESFSAQSRGNTKAGLLSWTARNAGEAVRLSFGYDRQLAIYKRSFDIIRLDAPPGYEYNEAEMDRVALRKTLEFVLSQPQTFITLTFYRIYAFFFMLGWKAAIISVFFFAGAVITARNTKVRILLLLILAYASPYFLAVTWWYRYRYPIEPVILVVACYLPVLVFSRLYALSRKSAVRDESVAS